MAKVFKRLTALMLAAAILAPSTVWADTQTEPDVSQLRVSDEFAAKHPNGMFEVLAPQISTAEGEEFDYYVVRRGGTEGEVSVNIKAIEISAKYGEDFVLQEKDMFGFYHDLKKSEDNPTVFESQIELNENMLFTTDRISSGASVEPYFFAATDDIASAASAEAQVESVESAEENVYEESEEKPEEEEDTPQLISIDEGLKMKEDASDVEYSDNDMGDYTSALHKMHDEATGKATAGYTDESAHSLDSFFEPDDETKEIADDVSKAAAEAEGISYTMTFADGEAYKLLHVKIIDDDIYETQDILEFALNTPTNGAELGSRITSVVYINNDEKVERCELGFEKESYEVFSDAEGIVLKLVRKGNANDFLGVYVSTLADSAKADEHYIPVMGDVSFMPGETEKKIYVPFIKDGLKDITETVGFDITAETEDNANVTIGKAHVDILPYSNNDNKSLVNYSGEVDTAEDHSADTAFATIYSNTIANNGIAPISASNRTLKWTSTSHPDGVLKASVDWKGIFHNPSPDAEDNDTWDLVGIDHIDYHIEGGSWTGGCNFYLVYYEEAEENGSVDGPYDRTVSSSTMVNKGIRVKDGDVHLYAWTFMADTTVTVSNVIFTYSNFKLNLLKPDTLNYYVYTGTDENSRAETKSFSPGSTRNGDKETSDSTSSQVSYIKDESVYARGELSNEGRNYGCTVTNVEYTGNNKSYFADSGKEVKLDDDFIINYIYNGDQSKDVLNAKAVFARTEKVNKIHIEPYAHGQFKLGGQVYNDQDIESSAWCKNDLLRPEIIPDQGYHIASITATVDGKTREFKYQEDMPITENMDIKVVFEKDNKHVTILHDLIDTNIAETKEENARHGYVTGINMTGEVVLNDVDALKQALAEKKAEVPNTIMETPMSHDDFVLHSLSDEQKKAALLEYIDNTPELRTSLMNNNLPAIYSKVYSDYHGMPLIHLLKLIGYHYERGLSNIFTTGGEVRHILKNYMNENTRNNINFQSKLNDLEEAFHFDRNIIYYEFTYNNKIYSAPTRSAAIDRLLNGMFDDDLSHLTYSQARLLSQADDLWSTTDFLNKTDVDGLFLYYMSGDLVTELTRHIDLLSIYSAYADENDLYDKYSSLYDKYVDEVNQRNEDKKKAYNDYLAEVNDLQADVDKAIEDNLSKLANTTGHIDNLSIGDTVSLYAQPEEGYTAMWAYSDDNKTLEESKLPIYTVHVGDTFNFEVQAENATVKYCFAKINENMPNSIVTGQIIKPLATLRTPASAKVNMNDKSTYTGAAGVDVTIGSLDITQSEEINGKTYKVSTTTDSNGYFSVLVPHASTSFLTNLIFGTGGKAYIKHVPVLGTVGGEQQEIRFALPFQDENIWVNNFEFDCNEDKVDGITLEDKNITATADFSVADGYTISQVALRSYTIDGELVKEWVMDKSGNNKYTSTFNGREYLRDGGSLTIEAYDIYGRGCGAVETGVKFTKLPDPVTMEMPDISDMGMEDLDIVGEISPSIDMGAPVVDLQRTSDYSDGSFASGGSSTAVEPSTETTTAKYEVWDFYLGSGSLVKAAIGQAGRSGDDVFQTGTSQQRVASLASVLIDPGVTNITGKQLQSSPADKGSLDANTKNSKDDLLAADDSHSSPGGFAVARRGKLNWNIKFGLGYYLRFCKVHTDGDSQFLCEQMYIILGFEANGSDTISAYIGAVPIYLTFAGGVTIKGLWGIYPRANKILQYTEGMKLDDSDLSSAGLLGVLPRFTIGAGAGWRGFLSAGVSGNLNFNVAAQKANVGAATFQFGLNLDIDLAFVPLNFRVLTITKGLRYDEGMVDNGWLNFNAASNKNDFSAYVKSLEADKPEDNINLFPEDTKAAAANIMSISNGAPLGDDDMELRGSMQRISRGQGNTFETTDIQAADESTSPQAIMLMNNVSDLQVDVEEIIDDDTPDLLSESRLRGTLRHPSPHIMHLGNGKSILFYMGDDITRDDYDCQTLFYMIYNDGQWSEPKKVDDDGTADLDYSVAQAGDSVMVVYSDLSKTFGNSVSDMPDFLNSADLSFCVFDQDGNISTSEILTQPDGFSNSMPEIAYDSDTGRTFIAYLTTDYSDTNADFSYDTVQDLDKFLNNAYSTVCYKMLDGDFNEVGYTQNEASYIAYEDHYGRGSLDNQRFMPLVENTLGVSEMTAHTYGGNAYVTYTVDKDGNADTNEDMEIYASVVDINNNSSFGPIRLTTNDVQDSNPQTVAYDNKVYLYWNRDGNIVSTNIGMELAKDVVGSSDGYMIEDMDYTLVQKGAEAAQTFDVTMQPDGNLYLIWDQLDSSTKFDENGENPPEVKRSLYMRMYDPHRRSTEITDKTTGQVYTTYQGSWGAAGEFDVPDENNTLYSEHSFMALDKDNMMCAFRSSRLETDSSGNTSISPNSDLVIHGYRVVSSVEVTDVHTEPEYPVSGHDATLYVKASNVGVVPCDTITFTAKMTDGEGNVTDLGECVVNTHCAAAIESADAELGDDEAEGMFTFRVPDAGDTYKFTITAHEDDLTEEMFTGEFEFDKTPVVENIEPAMRRINNDEEDITAVFTNHGNKATGDMIFTVKARDREAEDGMVELLSVPVPSLDPHDTETVKEVVDISGIWGDGSSQTLYMTLEDTDGTALYRDSTDIHLISDEDLEITDILINGGDESAIEVNAGETVYPHFNVAPYGAGKTSRLTYSISDSSIADIDPSNGSIYGKKEGTATVTVTAIKKSYSLFMDEDDNTYDNEGNLLYYNKDGITGDIADTDDETAVMSKTIQVNVTGSLPETTTEAAPETTTTAAPSTGGNSGGGRAYRTKTVTTTQATTEAVTEATTQTAKEEPSQTVTSTGFEDVKGMWCEDMVNTLHSLGLISGRTENTYAPEASLTRAELVQLIANLEGVDLSAYASTSQGFEDVDENAWYYKAVMWAADNNIVYGIGNGMFAPDTSITREDTAAIIYRYLALEPAENSSAFSDSEDISGYASEAVNTLSAEGIISGYPDNTFRPGNTITRAEMAAVLYKVNER